MSSYTSLIIEHLSSLQKDENNTFKKNAYRKAIQNLKDLHIHSIDDVKNISGIGKSILSKIQYIIDHNSPVTNTQHISFTDIYGIGPVKSTELIQKHNITSIQQLRQNTHLLNNKQIIGLKYYEHLLLRIPYSEMLEHSEFIEKSIKKTDNNAISSIVGSFRRKKPDSGDIDVLIISDKSIKKIVSDMNEYILEILALSDKKFMGICSLGVPRRIDMLITPKNEFPYAQLYFTGSKEHNIMMRKKARQLGYSLNEKNLDPIKENIPKAPIMNNEKDIFDFLKIEYKNPENR